MVDAVSAEGAVHAAMLRVLRCAGPLRAMLNGVRDGPGGMASAPYAEIGECLGGDWGAKGMEGREVRIGLTLHDRGESAGRLGEMMALADAALRGPEGLEATVGGGWRAATVALIRSRIVRRREEGWTATMDYRVRVVAAGG